MTETARIVVIGGGVVGCSILYHLAKAGARDALLLERAELTAGATWHAAGNVHTQSAIANLSALQAYSLRLYDGLAEEVGQEVGSHVVGGIFLAQTRERMEEFRHLAGKFKALGLVYELITPDEIKARHPLIETRGLLGGAWDPEEGYVDPASVTMGLAAGARKYGARIRRQTRVTAIERRGDGWRLSILGADGEPSAVDCEIVVNAAGFWADAVARMVGARLPVTNMEHLYLVTDRIQAVADFDGELPMIRDMDAGFYMRQERDGLLAGPWERDCRLAWGGDQAPWSFGQELFQPDYDRVEDGLARIIERAPSFGEVGVRREVCGAISFAPDGRPMIGPLPGLPGFFVAAGFLGGIAQAGGIGLAMAHWILDGEPHLDLAPIDIARFGGWMTQDAAAARTREIYPLRYEIIYPGQERASARGLRRAPIHERLEAAGAVFGQAFGWERPLWFAAEGEARADRPSFRRPNWWAAVGREACALAHRVGLIDMTSYAKLMVEGPDARAFLDHVGSARAPAEDGSMALTLLLNEKGGVIGDLAICRLAEDRFYLVGATLAEQITRRWLERHTHGFDVRLRVVTPERAALGLAGPESRALLAAASGADLSDFAFMRCRPLAIGGVEALALRVSYSGELGWELHSAAADQPALYDALTAQGARFGLAHVGARALSHLRLEKGYRSWGAELTAEVTPAAAGLERFCSRRKDYIGRAAVDAARDAPPPTKLATLVVEADDADCWGSEPVFRPGEARPLGYVTSGGYGWRIDKSLAVGWLDSAAAEPGTALEIEILGERRAARVAADPLYDPLNERLLA